MNMQMICSLFTLFSGEEDVNRFMPLLMVSIEEIREQLCEGADDTDVRLCYLSAAVANLRYTTIYGAREKALATYAGNIARQSDGLQQLQFAEHLVNCYRGLCSDLLRNGAFVFEGVRG